MVSTLLVSILQPLSSRAPTPVAQVPILLIDRILAMAAASPQLLFNVPRQVLTAPLASPIPAPLLQALLALARSLLQAPIPVLSVANTFLLLRHELLNIRFCIRRHPVKQPANTVLVLL